MAGQKPIVRLNVRFRANPAKAEASPCGRRVRGLLRRSDTTWSFLCLPEYEAISPQLSFANFQGSETTDWINVGKQGSLYLLVMNLENDTPLRIKAQARYRYAK